MAPAAQGKGVGEALLRAAEVRLERPATLRCLHVNARAQRLYERVGNAVRETQELALHGRRSPSWLTSKEQR